ncbi:MAG: hypothetical protein AB8F34_02100 [Akkermansiaceae bacterium]
MGKKQQIAKRKQELTAELAKNRVLISVGRNELKQKLNVKKQITKLLTRKPKALFIGSLGAGLLATLLIRRPRKTAKGKPSTKSTVLLGWILAIAKPAAKAWLVKRAKTLAVKQLESRQQLKNETI